MRRSRHWQRIRDGVSRMPALQPENPLASPDTAWREAGGENVLVGTAGWADPSLVRSRRFYPPGCATAEARLRFYASQFPTVEVDSSYYAMPSRRNSMLWVDRTPDDFLFNVKAFRALTLHQTPRKAMPPDLLAELHEDGRPNVYYKDMPATVRDELWRRFIDAVEPLSHAGKLGALHFQFPPWFVSARENYDYMRNVRERLAGFHIAIEFRHHSWFDDEHHEATLLFERELGLVNVVVDEPQGLKTSVPAVWEITNPEMAVVRLHGRNVDTWEAKGVNSLSDRFNYDYSHAELVDLSLQAARLAQHAHTVQIIFNNSFDGQGVRNGRMLQGILASDAC